MERIRIDNSTPSSMAHLVDMRDKVMLQHGGLCTRLCFDSVEQMDLETFTRVVLPKMKGDRRTLTVIRDAAAGSFMLMLGDQVLRYKLTNVEEVGLADFAKGLQDTSDETFTPDIPYPLVLRSVRSRDGAVVVVVRVDAGPRMYRNGRLHLCRKLYMPPVWFKVTFTKAGCILGESVAVVPENEKRWDATKLYRWPLANVFPTSQVCLGSTRLEMPAGAGGFSEGEIVQLGIDQFFNSDYNLDLLLGVEHYQRMLGDDHGDIYMDGELEAALRANRACQGVQGMASVIKVLEDPNGWRTLSWVPLNLTAEAFCRNDR